jgi:hypothetical protein
MVESSVALQIALGEIAGKNSAIHAYDRMIWQIRARYLSLFFGGWGILLKGIVENSDKLNVALMHRVLLTMWILSVALSAGGYVLDRNYPRRKFRVIFALDKLLELTSQQPRLISENDSELRSVLQVSGDKSDRNYLRVSGYRLEASAGRMIYTLPLLASGVGSLLLRL